METITKNVLYLKPLYCFINVSFRWLLCNFKDTINPIQLFVENFSSHVIKQAVVLNSMICFSVRFCDNSLLVLKMRFQVFSFASKNVQGFSSDRKILMTLLSVLFHLQNCVSVFEILIFSQVIWGNVHYVAEINLIS